MSFSVWGVRFGFSFWFFAALGCFALGAQGALLFYFALPIALHELGHLLVMAALGASVSGVYFSAGGIDIRRDGRVLSYGREIAVTAGGAAANLAMALLLRLCHFQTTRVMLLVAANLAVALFNLLPVGNLDGGQLLRLVCARFLSQRAAHNISLTASFCALVCLFGLSGLLLLRGYLGPAPLAACACLAMSLIKGLDKAR